MPHGSLKKELVACLRQGNGECRPRSSDADRRNKIPDLVSINVPPPDSKDRLMPGHRKSDLIISTNNHSLPSLRWWNAPRDW